MFLAIRRRKMDGGETNVALRGVEPMTFEIHGDDVQIVEGENFTPGSDELIVGEGLLNRIPECKVDEVMWINTVPFRITGVFAGKGGYRSEIWGDLERLSQALQRTARSRVIAQVTPSTDLESIQSRYDDDLRVQPQIQSERAYLTSQTEFLTLRFSILGGFLAAIMGIAAVFTGTNAMLSAISSRMHEIGILKAIGYRPLAIFTSFLLEAVFLGVLGGIFGCLLVLPFQGYQTGTSNGTFSEVTFAFRTTPLVLIVSIGFAATLGVLGGAFPAIRASRMAPTEALHRG
ncbi:MAG: ABC transporter permease [Planctomycetota bacterium]|nr:ABC transporter permease [Planctomycetota bacterium]